MRNLLLLMSGLCLVGCDNQKPQKSAASPARTEVTVAQPGSEVRVSSVSPNEIIVRAKAEVIAEQAQAVAQTKAQLVGRWTNKDTVVDKGIISSDKTDVYQRNITLSADGQGSYIVLKNDRGYISRPGKWNLQGDILYIDENNGSSEYWRLLRISNERLVLRNDEGKERIYDRIQ